MTSQIPLNRWGRLAASHGASGAYVHVEREDFSDSPKAPSSDAFRLWHRRAGVPDDHDDNYTFWFEADHIEHYFGPEGYLVAEWLPAGVEPSW